jgi:tetratricopeptide (TPR) repeat protein
MSRRSRRIATGLIVVLAILIGIGVRHGGSLRREDEFRRAQRAVANGHLIEAIDWLDPLISERPLQTRARRLRVEVARRLGKLTDAEERLSRTVELGLPVQQALREHLLIVAERDFTTAKAGLQRLVRADAGDVEVHRVLVEGLLRQEWWADTVQAASAWIKAARGDPEPLRARGLALAALRRFAEAETDLNGALGLDPENVGALMTLARVQLETGRLREAETAFDQASKLRPGSADAYLGLADVAARQGNRGRATAWADRALAANGLSVAALVTRAGLASEAEERDLALKLLERAATLDPTDPAPRLALARLQDRQAPLAVGSARE